MAFPLTDEQKKIVDDRGGELLVSAAAGSGKTRVLVERLLDRVTREGLDLDWYRVATGFGLDRAEYETFAQEVYQGLLDRGWDRPEIKTPHQIGVTIGVHTGPTPIGVGLLRRAVPRQG